MGGLGMIFFFPKRLIEAAACGLFHSAREQKKRPQR
jgi:hypothetical protein